MKIKDVISRLKEVFDVQTNKELADKMGVKYQTLNTWIKRNKIPCEHIFEISQNELFDLNWLIFGKSSTHPQKPHPKQSVDINDPSVAIQGTVNGNINISIEKHKKEVTGKEDDLLEAYRALSNDLQDYYYYQIKADAIRQAIKKDSN